MIERELRRDEIALVWTIDRRETIDGLYHLEDEKLILRREHIEVAGWPLGEAEKYTPILLECFDRGGWAYGVFDDARLIGTAILEGKFIGANKDRLQLEFLHVSRAYRKTGLGTKLFNLAREVARQPRPLGAVGRDGGEAQDMLRRRRGGNGCERRERDERAGECAQHGHRVAAWPV